jgi:uncharacterized protein YgbK (DUF1537 family)
MTGARPLLTFYGDDFTGSTDLVLQYRRFGMEGIIFLGQPGEDELARAASEYQVVGIAGVTRALAPAEIAEVVEPAFRMLAALEPDFLQYKVCSTADSSPEVGSFAPAVRAGRRLTGQQVVPILVAQPDLGRYTVFSNHFAVDRAVVYRLDRQPVMSRHPVTPMTEADLREHVALQLGEPVGSVTVNELRTRDGGTAALAAAATAGVPAVIVDALTDEDLRLAGRAILDRASSSPVFAVGSGGLSTGVAAALGMSRETSTAPLPPAAGPCLAVSGSCSPSTDDQIQYAVEHGWHGIRLDVTSGATQVWAEVERLRGEVVGELAAGRSVVVYTCGGDQPRSSEPVDGRVVAQALASFVTTSAEQLGLARLLVAGGDTSGHVITALGATAMRSKTVAGQTLLCELQAPTPVIDGLEVVLKGGQIGTLDFFELVRNGDGDPSWG